MCIPIQFVSKDNQGRITHIGGSTEDGRTWGLTTSQAIAMINSGEWAFFVEIPQGSRTEVRVRSGGAGHYLSTARDNTTVNNLDNFPIRNARLEGVEPPFPLNIPGPISLVGVLKLRKIETGINRVLTELPIRAASPSVPWRNICELKERYWRAKTPKWFYVTCRLPFPAIYEVFVNRTSINSFDPAKDQIERISGDDIVRRRQLEDSGLGWFTWDLTLKNPDGTPDPNAPGRFSEVRLIIRPPQSCWNYRWFRVIIRPSSINRYCSGSASNLYMEITLPLQSPSPVEEPPPSKITVPDVRNLILTQGLSTLRNAGFSRIQILGPTAPSDVLRIESQSPRQGESVPASTTIWLTVQPAFVANGFKQITLSNSSSRKSDLEIFTFDYSSGQWESQGLLPYQGNPLQIDLSTGHTYAIAAVDSNLIGCNTGQPTEVDCNYWQPLATFQGNEDGQTLVLEIS